MPSIPIMRTDMAAMFVLFLKVFEPRGKEGREPYGSGRYSLGDPQHTAVGEGSLAFNQPELYYICRVALFDGGGKVRTH